MLADERTCNRPGPTVRYRVSSNAISSPFDTRSRRTIFADMDGISRITRSVAAACNLGRPSPGHSAISKASRRLAGREGHKNEENQDTHRDSIELQENLAAELTTIHGRSHSDPGVSRRFILVDDASRTDIASLRAIDRRCRVAHQLQCVQLHCAELHGSIWARRDCYERARDVVRHHRFKPSM
jgi:hypothetical protein